MKLFAIRIALPVVTLGLVVAGCATSTKTKTADIHQFAPAPKAKVGAIDMAPVHSRPATDLLREADKAFQMANAAQEKGDNKAALRHYQQMLELLVEADLDPAIFYSLREEFGQVIDESSKQAGIFKEHGDRPLLKTSKPSGSFAALNIPFPLPEEVLTEIDEIQNNYPKNFQAGLNRGSKYIPYLKTAFKQAGLPEELVYVAMVESMYTPKIVSRAGAGGMWQFMKASGKRFDLRVDSYVDERYNWESSTAAAIEYFKALYNHFDGEWSLAIAAYNMGEGGLERAIASTGGERDFFKLIHTEPASTRIKEETKKYYPRFLATLIVASNPERYGFTITPQEPDVTTRIAVNGVYSLTELNNACSLPHGTLERLNPDLLHEMTPPGSVHRVAVPTGSQEKFQLALNTLPQRSDRIVMARESDDDQPKARGGKSNADKVTVTASAKSHTVKRGETVRGIASKYGVAEKDLLALNKMKSGNSLKWGNKIKIPANGAVEAEEKAKEEKVVLATNEEKVTKAAEKAAPKKSYTVRRGDTLFDIALNHKVTVSQLREWNNLTAKSHIATGQKLAVGEGASVEATEAAEPEVKLAKVETPEPEAKTAAKEEKATTKKAEPEADKKSATATHVVVAGDTPGHIAEKYGIPIKELRAANGLSAGSMLQIGQKLKIKGGTAKSEDIVVAKNETPAKKAEPAKKDEPKAKAKSGGDKIVHKVTKGENPTVIAARYGVSTDEFLQWNGLQSGQNLHVGQECVVLASNSSGGKASAKGEAKAEAKAKTAKEDTKSKKAAKDITHVVAKGHNPTNIAQEYGVSTDELFKWNGWGKDDVLMPGEKVVVKAK